MTLLSRQKSPAQDSKGAFILKLFSVRLMTVTGKLRLSIGRLSQSTNKRSEFSSHSHESSTESLHVNVPLEKFYHLYFSRFFHLHSCSADRNI